KVYYDLTAARAARGITDTAIVRMEQLYPLPVAEVREALSAFPHAEDFAWLQEEPANQSAWSFIALNLLEHLYGIRQGPQGELGPIELGGRYWPGAEA